MMTPGDPDRSDAELAEAFSAARRVALFWEREAVYRSAAVAGQLLNEIALAQALGRAVARFLDRRDHDAEDALAAALRAFQGAQVQSSD